MRTFHWQWTVETSSPNSQSVKVKVLVIQSCLTLCDPIGRQAPLPMEFSRQEGCHSFLKGNIPTQELHPGLLHCRQILYHLSHMGSPCSVYTSIKLSWNQWMNQWVHPQWPSSGADITLRPAWNRQRSSPSQPRSTQPSLWQHMRAF